MARSGSVGTAGQQRSNVNSYICDMQASGLLGLAAAFFGLHLELSQLAGILVGTGFVFTADQVLHADACTN